MASKKKRSKRAKKKERSGKTKSKKSKTKQKKGGGFCSCSKKHGKQKHRSERSKPTTPTPQLTAQAKPKLPPVVLPPPTALMPTIPSQSSQKPKAEAGDTPQSTVSTGKTSATSATATETSTPTSSTTTTINTTTKDNDEVDVETDGALEQPRQTFVVQKYTHEGRTIRYFDHKMIYHVDDRPPTFFPPTIKQFLAYQRRMKAVPLKKHEEMDKKVIIDATNLNSALKTLKALIQRIKDTVEKLSPEMRQCADDMESGVNQMEQLIDAMVVNNENNK